MTESEILQSYTRVAQLVLSIFSTFFAIVCAYVVALFYILHKSPLALRLLAFFVLTVGLAFLGGIGLTMQQIWIGLIEAWSKAAAPATAIRGLEDPMWLQPVVLVDSYKVELMVSWLTAVVSHVVLGYMTFVHRWADWGPCEGTDRTQGN